MDVFVVHLAKNFKLIVKATFILSRLLAQIRGLPFDLPFGLHRGLRI